MSASLRCRNLLRALAALPLADGITASVDASDSALLALRPRWLAIRVAMQADHGRVASVDLAADRASLIALPRPCEATSLADYRRLHDARYEALRRLPRSAPEPARETERREHRLTELCHAEDEIIGVLAATPARTPAGLAFKAEVFVVDDTMHSDLALSIAIDAMMQARKAEARI